MKMTDTALAAEPLRRPSSPGRRAGVLAAAFGLALTGLAACDGGDEAVAPPPGAVDQPPAGLEQPPAGGVAPADPAAAPPPAE